MSSGLFLTFEGPEGAGKTTQAEMLSAALESLHPVVVREPGGTAAGERLRELLLHDQVELAAETEMYLFLAARAELVARVVKPALAADRVVIADRYQDSTLAYQGGGRGLGPGWPAFFPRPDRTFLLALDPAVGVERRRRSGQAQDRLEAEPAEFHERVAAAYERLAEAEPDRFFRVDASLPELEVHARVLLEVRRLLAEREAAVEAAAARVARSS